MIDEQIIKKEDDLVYSDKGSLVLTATELSFITKKKSKKVLSIPLNNILNVRAGVYKGGADHLFISYTEEGKEKKAQIRHIDFWSGALFALPTLAREPYFKTWEKAIDERRLSKAANNDLNDLERLAELRTKGVLTEEEFTAKKKQLLGI